MLLDNVSRSTRFSSPVFRSFFTRFHLGADRRNLRSRAVRPGDRRRHLRPWPRLSFDPELPGVCQRLIVCVCLVVCIDLADRLTRHMPVSRLSHKKCVGALLSTTATNGKYVSFSGSEQSNTRQMCFRANRRRQIGERIRVKTLPNPSPRSCKPTRSPETECHCQTA